MSEINLRVRPDPLVQAAFGRTGCAEQSVVSDTLNACTATSVQQMKEAVKTVYRAHSQGYRHDYDQAEQLLDVDMTGMPAGRQGEAVTKGYFAGAKNQRGRQLGRVVATLYDEIMVEHLYPGKRQLDASLQELVGAAAEVLGLDTAQRARTVVRVDGGGGTEDDITWLLEQGYAILVKLYSWRRTEVLCRSVSTWYPDPKVAGREVGWIETPQPFVRSTQPVGIRTLTKKGTWTYHVLVFSLTDESLFRLGRQPVRLAPCDKQRLFAALYAYDLRSGGIETINKGSKQGLGLTKRNKKSFSAQVMLVLLAQLAYNLISWTRRLLVHADPAFPHLGALRMVRDAFHIPGRLELNAQGHLLLTLNRRHPWAPAFVAAFGFRNFDLFRLHVLAQYGGS